MNGLLHLTWNTHGISLTQSIDNLRSKGIFCDVTIACKGKFFPLHRFLLSTCSEYFDEILTMTPCHHPFIIVKDIEVEDLEALLDFIYRGKVDIPQHQVMSVVKAAEALKIKGFGVSKDSPDQLNKKFSNKTEMANMEQDSSGKENENVMHSELEQEQITVSDEQTISAVDFQSNTIQDTSQTQEQSLCIKVKKIPYGKSLLISRKRKKHNLLRSSLQQKKRKKVGLDETEKLKLKIKKPIVNEESPNLANTFRLTPVCSNSALSSNNNSDKQTPCIQEVESEIFFKNLDDVFDDQDNDIVVEDTLLSLPGSYPIVESDPETNTGVGDDVFIVKTEPHSESSSTSSVGNSKNAKKGELLFYVVEVVEEKEKAVIPANWMINDSSNKCHWPPMYADAFELASKYSSPEAHWSVRDVNIIKSFNSYSSARKYQENSSLPSDVEETDSEKPPIVEEIRVFSAESEIVDVESVKEKSNADSASALSTNQDGQEEIKKEVKEMQERLIRMEVMLGSLIKENCPDNADNEGVVEILPVDKAAFLLMEEMLCDLNQMKKMVRTLSMQGGLNCEDIVKRALTFVLKSDMGLYVTWSGQGVHKEATSKLPLNNSKLVDAIIGALKKAKVRGTIKDVKKACQLWLKNSYDRTNAQKRRTITDAE